MHWLGYFAIGLFIGGGIGVLTMSLMFAASRADDQLLQGRQYEE